MKTVIGTILTVLVGLSFVVGVGVYCSRSTVKTPTIIYIQDPIPSQREIQQRLKDLDKPRYDPNGIDGHIGTDSRTAWDNYTKDQYAKRAIEGE